MASDTSIAPAPDSTAGFREAQTVVLVAADEVSAKGAAIYASRLARRTGGEVVSVILEPARGEEVPPELEWSAVVTSGKLEPAATDNVRDAIEDACANITNPIVVLVSRADWPLPAELRRLVASPAWPLLVLFNGDTAREPAHTLVATNTFAPLSRAAREMSYSLISGEETKRVDFLRLIEEDSHADVELYQEALRERVRENAPAFEFDVIVRRARSFESGILDTLGEHPEYDLVLVDAPREGLIARLSERAIPRRLVAANVPVLLYASPAGPFARAFMRAWDVVYGLVPNPSEADRIATYTHVRRNSRASADFQVLLALSVVIASFGLLLGSPAVVIGAMIVAPLMLPVLGVGLGTATANARLTRIAGGTVIRGIIIAVVVSWLIGVLVPTATVTDELNARGQPTLLDLLVALASGAAGAYAMGRKGAASSVAGVAIAVALVPPLATAGIGIALREESLAIGASLLFVTNVTAIGAMSAMMFLWMGFKPAAGRFGTRTTLAQGLGTLGLMVLVVAFFIVARSRASDARFEREVFVITEVSVLGVDPEAHLDSIALETRGNVLIISAAINPESYSAVYSEVALIQSDITRQLGRPAVVQLFTAPPD